MQLGVCTRGYSSFGPLVQDGIQSCIFGIFGAAISWSFITPKRKSPSEGAFGTNRFEPACYGQRGSGLLPPLIDVAAPIMGSPVSSIRRASAFWNITNGERLTA